MEKATNPPVSKGKTPYSRKVLLKYDEAKFSKTIARLTPDLLSEVKIGVWALNPNNNGRCINLLESTLSGSEFDELTKKAAYTTFEGSTISLRKLGVA